MSSKKESTDQSNQIAHYRLQGRLGAGGMGMVFRGFDTLLRRPVALKRLRPGADNVLARRRFRREARAAAGLNHPNIVKVHDFLTEPDGDWIVMELVEGWPVASFCERRPLPIMRALSLAKEIVSALACAHKEGVVHRDLKAKNVLMSRRGHAKVLDFGLAKIVNASDSYTSSISIEGQLMGTPHAMSPEQAMGRQVDPRSDLFSLGSLLYQMFSGISPFYDSSPVRTLTRVCTFRQVPLRSQLSTISLELSDLVDHLLEKDPAHRPQEAEEVLSSLRLLAQDQLDDELPTLLPPQVESDSPTIAEPMSTVAVLLAVK